MNIEELIVLAEIAIENRPTTPDDYFHLCDCKGFLGCLPRNHDRTAHRIFYDFSKVDIGLGLKSKAWIRIGAAMKDFYKEGTPCLRPLEH